MLYISGVHALNLECSLETCGDWHTSALRWKDIEFRESDGSVFGVWGIECGHKIPERSEDYMVANHIRALLDLIVEGKFSVARGMREDFICNEKYTPLVFDMVYRLKALENWENIRDFMKKEYKMSWLRYLDGLRGRCGNSN